MGRWSNGVGGKMLDRIANEYRRVTPDRDVLLAVHPRMKCGPSLVAFAESVEKSVTPPHVKVVERDEAQPERAGEIAFIGSGLGVQKRRAYPLYVWLRDRRP